MRSAPQENVTAPITAREAWWIAGITAVLACAAWLRGGTSVTLQGPFLWLGVMLLVPLFFPARGTGRPRLWRLRRDPVVYLGVAFLALLAMQWWNAGRAQIFDYTQQEMTYAPPPHPHLPSAFTRDEAGEMLRWFFPAWVLVVVVRAGVLGGRAVRFLFLLVVLNATLLAGVGMVNFFIRPPGLEMDETSPVFASFGYSNHAGAFFALNSLIAAGCLMHELVGRGHRRKRWGLILASAGAVAMTMIGASLSMSRAGMLSCGVGLGAICIGVVAAWYRLEPALRLHVVVGCVVGLCLGLFLIQGLGQKALARKVNRLVHLDVGAERAERGFQARAAVQVWWEQPWFGVGGWGYRYLMGKYVAPVYWDSLGVGKANVHNDALQFLAEFGLIGAGLMAAFVLALLRPLWRCDIRRQPLVLFPLLGLGLTFAHSMIDLPFRCPAIIWLWVTVLAALPRLCQARGRSAQSGRPAAVGAA